MSHCTTLATVRGCSEALRVRAPAERLSPVRPLAGTQAGGNTTSLSRGSFSGFQGASVRPSQEAELPSAHLA